MFERTKQLGTGKDTVLVSSGANVNLTVATGGERYGQFRSGSRTGYPVCGNARVPASCRRAIAPCGVMVTQIERAPDQMRTLAAHIGPRHRRK
jgi:hypothetical protein